MAVTSEKRHNRRGSMYVVVLGASTAIAVIGLAALTSLRINRHAMELTSDFTDARLYAQSAIEIGMFRIKEDPNWRTTYPQLADDVWELDQPIGSGTYTLTGVDPNDADLANNDTDPVVLTGLGMQGEARYMLQVTVVAEVSPLEALSTCLHAADEIQVKGGDSVTVTGAPLSTNGNLRNDEIVYGDAHAATLSGGGTITGEATIPAQAKDLPDPRLFDMYKALATATPLDPDPVELCVIGPGSTPWGVTNPDGVYYIDTAGSDLHIRDARVYGTLVVDAPGKKLILEDPVFIQPVRSDYPALIVNGNIEFKYKSDTTSLDEASLGINLDPPSVPYDGIYDDDLLDTYPNEVHGLIHVLGTINFIESARVRGVIIGGSTVVCDKDNEVVHDATLYSNPPIGYTTPPVMKISQGSWRQVVD